MITTRGKDNISDVGRQKCVIIILVYAYFQFDWKRRMSYLPMFCATSSLNALCKQMRTEETSCSFEYKIVWELCLFLMLPGSLKTFPVLSVSTACHCDVMWFQIPEFFGIKNAYLCNLLYVNTFFIFFTFERFNPTGMYFQVQSFAYLVISIHQVYTTISVVFVDLWPLNLSDTRCWHQWFFFFNGERKLEQNNKMC